MSFSGRPAMPPRLLTAWIAALSPSTKGWKSKMGEAIEVMLPTKIGEPEAAFALVLPVVLLAQATRATEETTDTNCARMMRFFRKME